MFNTKEFVLLLFEIPFLTQSMFAKYIKIHIQIKTFYKVFAK